MEKDGARTLSRSIALLDAVASSAPSPRKLSELVIATGLHKATAHRLLASLVSEGLVEPVTGGYIIGPRCWTLGLAAARRYELGDIVQPSLERVADASCDVALFSVRMGVHARCIGRVEGSHPILPTSIQIGAVRPLGCGAHALAILAALPDSELEHAMVATREERRSTYDFFTDDMLLKKVEESRARQFATAEGEIVAGMAGVALAVRDRWGNVVGAISCAAIADRMPEARHDLIIELLKREVEVIEVRLGRSAAETSTSKGASHGQAGKMARLCA